MLLVYITMSTPSTTGPHSLNDETKSKMLGKIKKLIGKYERIDNPRVKREMTADQKTALIDRLAKGREAKKAAKVPVQ